MTPDKIRRTRRKLRLTQAALAKKLRVSVDTVRAWERGACTPLGPARVLLEMLESAAEARALDNTGAEE